MKYFYSNTTSYKNKILINEINQAATRLTNKILSLNLNSLNISDYNNNYLKNKFKNPISTIQMNAYLLFLCLDGKKILKENFTIVDYGGGSGLFSLLAKEFGIDCVIYNDIYDISCQDIKKLSKALNLKVDQIICGEIDDLISDVKNKNLSVDALCSYDVIEHIYKVEEFLRKCKNIPNNNIRLILGSGANDKNPIIKRDLQKKHYSFEYTTRPSTFGHKKRDSLKSFLKIREEIISKSNLNFNKETIKKLALKTRGLRKDDILFSIKEYYKTGKMTYKPNHPTNSCDPLTGNWNEQLMEPDWLKNILITEGFNSKVLPGFWGDGIIIHKTFIKRLLNLIIKFSGPFCLVASPYYIIYADYKLKND